VSGSATLTPFFWQSSNSLFFIARDALVASGTSSKSKWAMTA
jgi:hypothetical protein